MIRIDIGTGIPSTRTSLGVLRHDGEEFFEKQRTLGGLPLRLKFQLKESEQEWQYEYGGRLS